MFTWMFWRSATERAVKTFAQSLAACLGASGAGLWEVEWTTVLAVAGMTTLLSLLSSVASAPVGADHRSPSLLPPPAHAAPAAGAARSSAPPRRLLPASG